MNKYIKLLTESLFDDIDDIFSEDDEEDVMGDVIVDFFIEKLLSILYNKTKYNDNVMSCAKDAEIMALLGNTIVTRIYSVLYSYNKLNYCFKCYFKQDDDSLLYNKIVICEYNNYASINLFEIYITGNHIHYIQYLEPYKFFVNQDRKSLSIKFFSILPYILDEYTIDEIRLIPLRKTVGTYIIPELPNKTIIYFDTIQQVPKEMTLKLIQKMPIFTVPNKNNEFENIGVVFKNSEVDLGHLLVFDTLETMYNFLEYLRKQGFKKIKMISLCGIIDGCSTEYNGIKDSQELFLYFMEKYNLELYSFSDKREIERIVVDKTEEYCANNLEYDNSGRFIFSVKYGLKSKDNKGTYVEITIDIEQDIYDNHKYSKHVYYKLLWKFYKSGRLELVNLN